VRVQEVGRKGGSIRIVYVFNMTASLNLRARRRSLFGRSGVCRVSPSTLEGLLAKLSGLSLAIWSMRPAAIA
jgi:hypothetical protein